MGRRAWFVSVIAISRFVSLGSVVGAISLVPFMWFLDRDGPRAPLVAFAVLAAVVIVVRHRANISRLVAGTEPRIFAKKEAPRA